MRAEAAERARRVEAAAGVKEREFAAEKERLGAELARLRGEGESLRRERDGHKRDAEEARKERGREGEELRRVREERTALAAELERVKNDKGDVSEVRRGRGGVCLTAQLMRIKESFKAEKKRADELAEALAALKIALDAAVRERDAAKRDGAMGSGELKTVISERDSLKEMIVSLSQTIEKRERAFKEQTDAQTHDLFLERENAARLKRQAAELRDALERERAEGASLRNGAEEGQVKILFSFKFFSLFRL